jgi:hypothetical protein
MAADLPINRLPTPASLPQAPATPTPAPIVTRAPPPPQLSAPSFAAAPQTPLASARSEVERNKDVDELASVIFKIDGLDNFTPACAGQVHHQPSSRLAVMGVVA